MQSTCEMQPSRSAIQPWKMQNNKSAIKRTSPAFESHEACRVLLSRPASASQIVRPCCLRSEQRKRILFVVADEYFGPPRWGRRECSYNTHQISA